MFKIDSLDTDRIKNHLKTKRIGKMVMVFSSTSSTNDIAAEYAKNKDNDGLAIFAEEQTKGRGRAGNKWLTGKADSLICSIVLIGCKLNLELLSLTCAVAVADAIDKIGRHHAKIKWPNDVLINGKKIAGILLESKTHKGTNACVIGIGINCHQNRESLPVELQQTATSIDIEGKTTSDRISLAKRLLTSLDHWLDIAEKDSRKAIDQWNKLSIQSGHRVTVVFNRRKFTGNCIGIDPEKGLILQLDKGAVRMFNAAHTSIAK